MQRMGHVWYRCAGNGTARGHPSALDGAASGTRRRAVNPGLPVTAAACGAWWGAWLGRRIELRGGGDFDQRARSCRTSHVARRTSARQSRPRRCQIQHWLATNPAARVPLARTRLGNERPRRLILTRARPSSAHLRTETRPVPACLSVHVPVRLPCVCASPARAQSHSSHFRGQSRASTHSRWLLVHESYGRGRGRGHTGTGAQTLGIAASQRRPPSTWALGPRPPFSAAVQPGPPRSLTMERTSTAPVSPRAGVTVAAHAHRAEPPRSELCVRPPLNLIRTSTRSRRR